MCRGYWTALSNLDIRVISGRDCVLPFSTLLTTPTGQPDYLGPVVEGFQHGARRKSFGEAGLLVRDSLFNRSDRAVVVSRQAAKIYCLD